MSNKLSMHHIRDSLILYLVFIKVFLKLLTCLHDFICVMTQIALLGSAWPGWTVGTGMRLPEQFTQNAAVAGVQRSRCKGLFLFPLLQ